MRLRVHLAYPPTWSIIFSRSTVSFVMLMKSLLTSFLEHLGQTSAMVGHCSLDLINSTMHSLCVTWPQEIITAGSPPTLSPHPAAHSSFFWEGVRPLTFLQTLQADRWPSFLAVQAGHFHSLFGSVLGLFWVAELPGATFAKLTTGRLTTDALLLSYILLSEGIPGACLPITV